MWRIIWLCWMWSVFWAMVYGNAIGGLHAYYEISRGGRRWAIACKIGTNSLGKVCGLQTATWRVLLFEDVCSGSCNCFISFFSSSTPITLLPPHTTYTYYFTY
ncbi:hypothetical protein BGX38DRAFT_80236 [Terfezia claveryi]|nr:hypothetical protein BGX38DRAFT_80236 [Terfezia claveryi]